MKRVADANGILTVPDLVGTAFANRHTQYETFYDGAPAVALNRIWRFFRWEDVDAQADRALKSIGTTTILSSAESPMMPAAAPDRAYDQCLKPRPYDGCRAFHRRYRRRCCGTDQRDVATSRAIIQAVNVSKVYNRATARNVSALTGLNLEVGENEFLVIVGPSGCGKSTLLKLIVGLLPVTDGTIYFHGQPVRGPRTDVGMVFQEPVLLPWRTVRQNVLFPIEILRRKDRDYVEESDRLLTLVGLSGFQDKMPYELSGGMQQRAAICRALIHDPTVLVMDEPFGALDAMTRDEMGAELLRIWQHRRKTVIFVTHSIREAVWLADRVVVMTARPAKIADIIKIDFERPRTDKMQFLPQFGRYVEEIGDIVAGRRAKGLLCQD